MKSLPSAGHISDLIGAVYDCAIDPMRWGPTLERIVDEIHCANASFSLTELPSNTFRLQVTTGIPEEYRARMGDFGPEIAEIWGGTAQIMAHPLDEPAVLSRIRQGEDLSGNRYYREWGLPQGLTDVIAVVLARDPRAYGAIGFGRHRSAGPVEEADLDLLRLLIPHMQRAVGISRMLDIKTIEAKTFEAALDAVSTAIVLVDSAMRIVHSNAVANEMLVAGDPIASVRGVLTVRSELEQGALAAAVAQARTDEAGIGRRGFGIAARDAAGQPAVLHVLPLAGGRARAGLSRSAVAAVFVAPSLMPKPAPEQALAALFDLTPAEARVFTLIAAGRTSDAVAQALGIGRSTVKTHLMHIFAKTGTNRQGDLVGLANTLALAL
ncbi:MAG: helix-turn-helix transcriptional regulator [Rhizobiaceae bacterium]|nr:helix-turn-helix transcriptional regulator [Rhizobiaceae bacterium]